MTDNTQPGKTSKKQDAQRRGSLSSIWVVHLFKLRSGLAQKADSIRHAADNASRDIKALPINGLSRAMATSAQFDSNDLKELAASIKSQACCNL